ncbi:MAG: hypothetical protein AAGF19_01550 [Pseudomonadota bacterium]
MLKYVAIAGFVFGALAAPALAEDLGAKCTTVASADTTLPDTITPDMIEPACNCIAAGAADAGLSDTLSEALELPAFADRAEVLGDEGNAIVDACLKDVG